MKKIVLSILVVAAVFGGTFFVKTARATAPKITVTKYVYMTLDPNGIYTNSAGYRYSYTTAYLGFFLRDGIIYFQTMDCSAANQSALSSPPCYYEYGVDPGMPKFMYGNVQLPSPQ